MAWIICKYGSGGGGGGDRPDGSTVTPVSDVPTWLRCGGLESKGYTTLSQVLADADTLNGLISDANAVNYLVRSTSWISDISVPAMTSATTPSGEVIWYGSYHSSSRPWYAFDKQGDSTYWQASNSVGEYYWLAYKFDTPVVCTEAKVRATVNRWDDWKIQGSLDGVNWTDLTSSHAYVSGILDSELTLNATIPYSYYRFYGKGQSATAFINTLDFIASKGITSNSSAMTYIGVNDYAAFKLLDNSTWSAAIANSTYFENVLTIKVPTMTSATTPSGQVIESGHNIEYYGWKTFDGVIGNPLDMWYGNAVPAYCGYKFVNSVKVYKWERRNRHNSDSTGVYSPINFQFQGSIDNINWYTINSYSVNDNTSSKLFSYEVNSSNYQYYRIYVTSINEGTSSYHQPAISNLQFYGRTFGDVQSWLKAGKVDKNYTTLEQVLSDSSTLQALMASSDAVDYLSACGEWASTICANQSAMNYIGLNNYAANTLLADACWYNAISNSAYMGSVLNGKVPTMTSNTAPSGEVFGGQENTSGTSVANTAYKSFNGASACVLSHPTSEGYFGHSGCYLGYDFGYPVRLYNAFIKKVTYGINDVYATYVLQASNDKSNWTNIASNTIRFTQNVANTKWFNVIDHSGYRYFRFFMGQPVGGTSGPSIYFEDVRLIGRKDV